jgi:hypothetical protein
VNSSTGVHGIDQLVIWSIAAVAIAGGVALLWRVTRGARHLVRRLDEFADDWQGLPNRPGVPGHAGVMARLGAIEDRLAAVEHELRPNSGSSMRDAIDRVDERTRRFAPTTTT